MADFNVTRNDVNGSIQRNFPYLAEELRSQGWAQTVTVYNDDGSAGFQAYATADGKLSFVYGSRSLFARFLKAGA